MINKFKIKELRRQFNILRHKIKYKIWERDDYICLYCGKKVIDLGTISNIALDNSWTWKKYERTLKKLYPHSASLDHIIPLSKGGTNKESNLTTCCISCNCKKGTKIYDKKQV